MTAMPGLRTSLNNVSRKAAVAILSRSIILVAGFSGICASNGWAQNTLASVVVTTDTTLKKATSAPAAVRALTPDKSKAFIRKQLEHERVFAARIEKRFEVKKLFRERGIAYPAAEIFLRAFKREHILEMWVRPVGQDGFIMFKTYEICALSEKPGPKRVRGDLQTPEGFYYINNFNPQSGFHLSLGVNYPNEADLILNGKDGRSDGGDIFIHGGCKTAGCVALTDEAIKEVYVIAMEARDNGQKNIPVHIFPARLTDEGLRQLVRVFGNEDPSLVPFWANLKTGYDYFEKSHKLPAVNVNKRGRYLFRDSADEADPAVDKQLLGSTATVEMGTQN
jgi:murein L,D-transpeptidase YafK